jgi:hypothetical protein
MRFGCMRAKRKAEKSMNISIINRGCSASILHGVKDLSIIYERSFMKFTA